MAAGHGGTRTEIAWNDFIIVGPDDDPAHIAGQTDVLNAFRAIAETKSPYVPPGGLKVGRYASRTEGVAANPDTHPEFGTTTLDVRQTSTRYIGFPVSVPVRPTADRKRGDFPPSRMPAASM
jgi:hypothetical protein